MTLVPIKLPAGIYRNGTDYGAKGRWFDGSLIRWHDGLLRPIGGWQRREEPGEVPMPPLTSGNPTVEVVRDIITYRDNIGRAFALFGSNAKLRQMDSGNQVGDVTPAGFVTVPPKVQNLVGYGTGVYGRLAYGTPRNPEDAKPDPVKRWCFTMWGENVLAAMQENGDIYEITPAGVSAVVANAPTDVQDVIVTDERIVMVLKNGPTETRQVIWSDREDNTEWTPAVDNYAGDKRLDGTGLLIGAYKVQSQILILSETDAHVATYLGAPYVYGFTRVGENCEPISANAVAKTDRFAIWLGPRNFWIYDGSLRPLECDVMDYIDQTLDRRNVSKIHTCTIADFSEIWWFYQSKDSETGEPDMYVVYDYFENHWNIGNLSRTAAYDQGALNSPIMVDAEGRLWNHEQSYLVPQGATFAISGPLELGSGEKNMAVRYVFPDTRFKGNVELAFLSRQMPTEPDITFGPFSYNNPISTTGVMGRELRLVIHGLDSQWGAGTMRFDVQQIGGGMR